MASDDASLQGLEQLLNEFFSTSNERKREIENVLHNFSQQLGAWRSCTYFLNHSKNHYVLMFSLSVFEDLVNKRWSGVQQSEKLEVRNVLSYYLMSQHHQMPEFIKNKLVKVLVDIGRQDWPHLYPDFFTNILEVLHQPETTALGLVMIKITSEELASSSEDLGMNRKEELRKLLLLQVPGLLTMLGTFLENILEKHRRIVSTATPPPSPTHGEGSQSASPQGETQLDLFSLSPPHSNNNRHSPLIGRLLNHTSKGHNLNNPLPPLDPDSEELSSLALACLAHLFSWIPLSASITPSLLATVFCFAEFGCDVLVSGSGMMTAGGTRLGMLAMDCVNEILSKNCVPAEFEEFLLRLFQQTFHLLQRITKESGLQSAGQKLLELDERYVEKFTEFLRLFVSVHLRRVESNSHFPVVEFLSLLLKYTIKQPDHEVFYSCLDIWMIFLDFLSTKVLETKTNHNVEIHPTVQRYRDVLVLLLTEILKNVQFTYNQSELEELDDETLNEDSETEWQRFLRHSLEIVAKVSELLPSEAFSILFPLFLEYSEVYFGLRSAMVKTSAGFELNIKGENECRRIHCTLRDLTTMQRVFGRLAGHFTGEMHFRARFDDGLAVVKRLCDLAVHNTQTRIHDIKTQVPSVLSTDFKEAAAGALASLQVYCHWLFQLHLHSQAHKEYENEFATIISSCVDAILPLLDEQIPDRLLLPASHFIVSLTTSVRPSFLLRLENVQKLYHEVSAGKLRRTPVEIETLIYRALSNALVLPWPNLPDDKQEWPSRSSNHDNLVKALTIHYQQMTEHSLADSKRFHAEAKSFIRRTLTILKDLVDAVASEATKSKTIVYKSAQESLHTTLTLFPIYIHEPDVIDSILGFLLAVFGSLQVQLGVAYTEQIIHRLLGMFTQEQLKETILHETSAGSRVLEKFLRILRILAQQPGSSFKTLLPNIINFCLDQIHPLIAERSAPDIKTEFFELLHQLLLNNWRYFFRSNIKTRVALGEDGTCENQEQFVKMMEAFGQTFTQTDITVFKQNLQSLENLNSKCKLYQKPIFSDGMLFHFLNVLLQVLVHRSHDLLREEIAIALYNMASSDFDKFYHRFLPEFLTACDGIIAEQKAELSKTFKMDKDLPSFTRGIHRFVSDVRYYRLYNSSLPPGSVTF